MDTPKEKAEELRLKYVGLFQDNTGDIFKVGTDVGKLAKDCAIICINELLDSTNNKRSFLVKHDDGVEKFVGIYDYWKQVKEEIEKL